MIVIVTYENYPDGSPGAIRNASFAYALSNLGYKVLVISKSKFVSDANPFAESLYNKNKYLKFFLWPYNVIRHLKKLKMSDSLDAVICYSPGFFSFIFKHWCLRNRIKVIFDIVEWYSKEQFDNWPFSLAYWDKHIFNKYVVNSRVRIIAISQYLQNYYQIIGCKTVRIPIILNSSLEDLNNNEKKFSDRIQFIYAGSHLKMDNIKLFLLAINLLTEDEKRRLYFVIFGLNKNSIIKYVGRHLYDQLSNIIDIRGRQPHSVVIESYKRSDFSVFFRNPNFRVNKAGFPSKVIESMILGVPVICNYSSDLHDFLVDEENAMIANSLDAKIIAKKLKVILSLSLDERKSLSLNSYYVAKNEFISTKFTHQFLDILS